MARCRSAPSASADGGKERRERVGAVVDMGRQLGPGGNRPMLGMVGQAVHQHRGHAERVRGLEVMRQVVEHRGPARYHAMRVDEAVIGLAHRLRVDVLERVDVADILELARHAEPLDHGFGMFARAVGEDEFAPGQVAERRRQGRGGEHGAQDRCRAHNRESHPATRRGAAPARPAWCRAGSNRSRACSAPVRAAGPSSAMMNSPMRLSIWANRLQSAG